MENVIIKHRLHPEVTAASWNSVLLWKESLIIPQMNITEVSFYSVFHRVSGGELFERIIDEDFELTERECIKYMKQISEGVQYIHKQGIVHLDLKPENIMCVNKTGTSIKLIDFGLARRLGNEFSAYFSIMGERAGPAVIHATYCIESTCMFPINISGKNRKGTKKTLKNESRAPHLQEEFAVGCTESICSHSRISL